MPRFELAGRVNKSHLGDMLRSYATEHVPADYLDTRTFFTQPEPLPDSILRKPLVSSPM